jgi:hypothetical protein
VQHLVVKLGPSRESTAKSRQALTFILERPHILGPFQRDEAVALVGANLLLDQFKKGWRFPGGDILAALRAA